MTQPTLQQVLDLGLQHHKAGRLHEAEGIYRKILSQNPEHSVAMHHLGLIAHQVGQNDVAVNLIRRAIAITLRPNAVGYYSNLGSALTLCGQYWKRWPNRISGDSKNRKDK